jgi:diguanylate cyclase (GGDEF)-like protein
VSLFAEHAAIAVANARLYEAERALSAQLSHQVVHDPLTGAANRVLISDRLGHALARVRRQESQVAVLFIDVDNFKLVNDELGHETGDFVLTAIAQRLAECVRPTDTVGRFGGDEFLVICEDLTHDGQGVEIAERILEGLSRPFETPFGERIVSASIGVAPCGSGRPESVANLIRAADQAMYRAKMEGKARIVSALTRAPGPA